MSSFNALTELEDLRLFVQEKVQEFDNSIDTTLGSTFDNAVIQPLISRLGPDPYTTDIVGFIRGKLQAEFGNDIIIQDGEPIDDLVVKPNRLLLEAFRRQIRQVSLNQSLANPELLNEKEADNLAGNFFVRRRSGGFSAGTARLFFSAPQFALVTPSNALFTGDGLQFFPIESQAIQASRMIFNEEDNLFYFDVIVRAAAQGSEYNIAPNTLVGIEGLTAAVKVTNKRKFEDGGNSEETLAFIERVENSLTEKSLVTVRGIRSRLTDVFENVQLIQVIGFGDVEMNRDILTGSSESAPYAWAQLSTTASSDEIDLYTSVGTPIIGPTGSPFTALTNFLTMGMLVGDTIEVPLNGLGEYHRFTITEIISGTKIRVTPLAAVTFSNLIGTVRHARGGITISDIPGGILSPSGLIEINDGEVHIGGALDVFVRGGDPQDRDTTFEGVLDGSPLRFGVDLETYGGEDTVPTHVTDFHGSIVAVPANDRFGNALTQLDEIVVLRVEGSSPLETHPWVPTEDDVGRFIQLIDLGASDFHGTVRISSVIGPEYYSGQLATRIKVDTADQDRGGVLAAWVTPDVPEPAFNLPARIVENISIKNRVRDRDGTNIAIAADDPDPGDPVILGGVNFSALGAVIGDSVVLETGDDAGIYSIRRILSWLTDNDTLILDRELTNSLPVANPGTQTGIRYRIADELDVDLVAPRVTKIPLVPTFTGDDLSTVAGSASVLVTGTTNFLLAGVEEGDTLEILVGDNKGKYGILSVTGTGAVLDAPVLNTISAQAFSVYRAFTGLTLPLVRIKDVELLDSNSQPTGITIPYGDVVDARTRGGMANRAQGNVVESFTGELQDNGEGKIDLFDANIDFVAEGVETGHRINIISGFSVESYTVASLGTDFGIGLTVNHVRVVSPTDDGIQWVATETNVHYSIGLPSSGFVRLFFLEPTSVEIATGLGGGRIQLEGTGLTPKEFRFSEVSGKIIVPSPGATDDDARDLRVARVDLVGAGVNKTDGTTSGSILTSPAGNFITNDVRVSYVLRISTGADIGDHDIISVDSETQLTTASTFVGDVGREYSIVKFSTIVELTDPNRLGVFELEIQNGDTVEVNDPIPFRVPNSGAPLLGQTFEDAGVFGSPAGLRSTAGDNRVSVPDNSLIDFEVMDASFPLRGQLLFIESGPDAGQYTIEDVLTAKSLRLNTVMTSTSHFINARDINARSGPLAIAASGSNTKLTDPDDVGQMLLLTDGQFVTIFESTRGDLDGTYKISDALAAEADSVEIEVGFTDHAVLLDTQSVGPFSWIATSEDTLVGFPFHIYKTIPSEFEVVEVAPKEVENAHTINGPERGDITGLPAITLTDSTGNSFAANSVERGDLVEILEGVNQGVYVVSTVSGTSLDIHFEKPFAASGSDVAYRIWGGLHGSRRMLRIGPKDSGIGKVPLGDLIPYRVVRPNVIRVSATEMEDNFDGTLYFIDVQVESQGAGNDLNLADALRMVVTSGLIVDGYTYSVDNENLSYSVFEEVTVNFDRRFLPAGNSDSPENLTEVSGRNLKVNYEMSTTTRLVNDLLRSDRDRTVNANPIARHFLPSFLFASLQYSGGVSEQSVGPELEDLVNYLGAESELLVSDLENLLTRRGATYVQHPIELVTVTHGLDRKLVVNRSNNRLGGKNTVPFNGTGRTSAFFTVFEETLLLVRES